MAHGTESGPEVGPTPQIGALQPDLKLLRAPSGKCRRSLRAEASRPAMSLCGKGEVTLSRGGEGGCPCLRTQAETQVFRTSESWGSRRPTAGRREGGTSQENGPQASTAWTSAAGVNTVGAFPLRAVRTQRREQRPAFLGGGGEIAW